jgi:hypothetical protein
MSRRFRVVAAAAVLALVGGVASGCPSSPSKPPRTTAATVTTSTGVVTHGSIATTENTIGWLLTCPLSHRLPDDPIVVPGVRGGAHLHDFTGNASTDATSTYATMTDLSNAAVADQFNGPAVKPGTSCDMATYAPGTAADTAAYWRPVLYANGQPVTSTVKDQLYYRAKPTFGTGFQAIPADARLIVGSHSATSVAGNQALAEGNLYWECNGITDVHYPTPPNDCKGGSILENVVFPSCWDGLPMDHTGPGRTDNGHFAYAVDGTCPPGVRGEGAAAVGEVQVRQHPGRRAAAVVRGPRRPAAAHVDGARRLLEHVAPGGAGLPDREVHQRADLLRHEPRSPDRELGSAARLLGGAGLVEHPP